MNNFYVILLLFFLFSDLSSNDTLKKVSLQLQWKHQFQFAGYYIAKEKGYYKDSGLDVDIKEFEYGMKVPNEILNKNSTYGIGRPTLMINRSNGDDVVLLASIFQSSPNILLATKDSGISTIGDFKNKRIMVTGDAKEDATIMSMIFSNALTLDDLIVQEHSFNIDDLINNKTDLMSSYISNEPFLLKEKGIESIIFDPKDYCFNFYNDILFTTQENIQNNSKDVAKFTSASIKGWEYAFNNIEETIELILKKYNTQNKSKKALLFEASQLKKLAYFNTEKLGYIDNKQIQKIYDYYRLMGFTKGKLDMDSFIYTPDRKFILSKKEQLYLKNKKKITYCLDPNWMPFEKIENGSHVGMSSDYINYFSKKLDTPMVLISTSSWEESLQNIKKGKCDILPFAAVSIQRAQYLNFTSPYFHAPTVIATKAGVPFIDSLSQIITKPLGVVKGYFLNEKLKILYPNINIVQVDSTDDGLKRVKEGEIFGYIDNSLVINHKIQKEYAKTLSISGKINLENRLNVAVNKGDILLFDIFQKLVDSIDEETKNNIENKWINIKYQNITDYTLLWQISITALILLMGSLYWNSRLRNLNKQLEIQKKKAEAATQAKSNFLANMSHEIRTPMNGILGLIHLALESKENKKQKEYLKFIDSSAKNLLTVLNDILDFSKIESNKLMIQNMDFNIYEIVDSALNLIEHKAQEKDIKLSVNYGDTINSTYYGDPVRLFQVLSNLLNNAVKFTDKGQVSININKISSEIVRFEVKDTGIGLSDDQINKLFQAFTQVDESITRQYEGTGLGLVISKKLVELMNGKIWVESIKGEGSSFIFEIQLKQKDESDTNDRSKSKNLDISRLKNSNILLVEDNSINQMIIKDLLEDSGINIDVASNGQEAVDIYNKNSDRYQLILMDLQMPVMDGIEAAKIIRKHNTDIPIIALTANVMSQHIEETKKAGMDEHLSKPIDINKLYSSLLDFIPKHHS